MLSWHELSEIPSDFAETVVTIGKFDGIHVGHQALLNDSVALAEDHSLASVAVTFDRHPNELFFPHSKHQPVTGPKQKLELFESFGLDATLTLRFDEKLAELSPEDFVDQILLTKLRARVVVVGEDFRYGSHGAGDIDTLRAHGLRSGFNVKVVSSVVIDGAKVSTTLIRTLLNEGNVRQAAKFLGRLHATSGVVEHGLKIGRTLGFPTANFARDSEGYLPLDGVYAGWLYADGQRHRAALSIGINDTLQAVPRLLEAHVLDRNDLDLYDKVATVEYVDFVRPSAKFSGVQELIEAIERDCNQIREMLKHEETVIQ